MLEDERSLTEEPTAVESPSDDPPDVVRPKRLLADTVRTRALEIGDEARKRIASKAAFEPEGIHDTRVDTKALRALWQLMRPVIEPQIARAAGDRLRELAHALAAARDEQITLELLADLRAADEPLYHGSFDRATALFDPSLDLAEHEAALRPAMLAAIDSDRADWKTLVLPDDQSLLEHGLGRAYRKTLRRAKTANRTRAHTDLHAWRRWVKYLRYQLEALFPEPSEEIAARIEGLRGLGKTLGLRNDLAVLRERLRERGGGDPFGAVFRAIDLRDKALATRIPEVAKHQFGDSPEEFVAAIEREASSHGSEDE
jgi:CHAD domain-containing protein